MSAPRVVNLTHLGWGLAIPVLFLSTVGLATIRATDRGIAEQTTSASVPQIERNWLSRTYHAIGPLTARQALYFITGIGLLFLSLWPSYQRIGRFAYLLYGIVIVLLLLLVLDRYIDLPGVPVRRYTRRWIQLGGVFTLQPSEFMKPVLVLALARYLRFRSSYRRWRGLIPPFLFTLLPMVLILFQPDLGTLLMLLPVLFIMLFVAGARLRHLLTIVLFGCATLPAFYFYGMADYQKKRIQVLFKQSVADERWHMNEGYQLRQSKIALGTGGLTGQGYGQGVFVRYDLLPDEHNDFIFAIIGNQWGLIGGTLVILAYGIIVLCGLEVVTVTNDPFGRLLAIGVIVMIVVQALINIGMTIGLAPITGMTLPFVSAGGSSLWANFLGLGLLVNVAQRRPMLIANPPFEHRDD
ncbi:MAG: FtsW/RodA/SpoVE family cell cycle protein [Planctomycetes bacterium]|nr:FtsW/RodA/SpoVE family cell cycle protein [Planctomycetota bacterium]